MQKMLAQEKMRKYQNLFFGIFYVLVFCIFGGLWGHLWALEGLRSHSTTLKTLDTKCRTLEDLSRNFDSL